MQLEVHQEFAGLDPSAVAAAYADPGLYDAFDDLPFVGRPEPVGHRCEDGDIHLAVRYAVQVELPAAARTFVDTRRLTFVEHSVFGPDGAGRFRIVPDHYDRLLGFAGTYAVAAAGPDGARRTVAGVLRVDLGWKGRLFERDVARVIGEGLTRSLHAQVPAVVEYLRS